MRVVGALIAVAVIAAPADAAPANDHFADAAELTVPGVAIANLSDATVEEGEPGCRGSRDGTVWYRFSTLVDMRVKVETGRLGLANHRSGLYTGEDLGSLRSWGCRGGGLTPPTAELFIHARAGVPVFIQVAGQDVVVPVTVGPAAAGDIEGTVTDSSGAPLGDMCVLASSETLRSFTTRTTADGRYVVTVPAGRYSIRFWDCGRRSYAAEWYDDVPDQSSATQVPVTPDETVRGIDASLRALGSISGRIDDLDGRPIRGACIDVWPEGGAPGDARAFSAEDGTYQVRGLEPGTHRVLFTDCGEDAYAGEWYDDQPSVTTATPVALAEGEHLTGIDAALAPAD